MATTLPIADYFGINPSFIYQTVMTTYHEEAWPERVAVEEAIETVIGTVLVVSQDNSKKTQNKEHEKNIQEVLGCPSITVFPSLSVCRSDVIIYQGV